MTPKIDRNANTTERARKALQAVAEAFDRLVLPDQSGTPTDSPTDSGVVRFDPGTNKLWIWNGTAWKSVTLT